MGAFSKVMGSRIFKTLSISYLALIINTSVSLITVPLLLNYFCQDIYGVFSITNDLIYYLSLLGFGVPWVAVTIFANLKTVRGKNSLVFKALILLTLISIILSFIFIIVITCFPKWIAVLGNIPIGIHVVSEKLVIVMIFSYLLRLPISIFNQLLVFMGEIRIVKYVEITNTIAILIVILIVKSRNLSVLSFAVYNGIISVVISIIYALIFIRFWKLYEVTQGDNNLVEHVSYKYIIHSGWFVLVTNIAGVIIWNTDNLVIGHMLGISYVAQYAIIFKLFLILSNVLTQILNIINPIYPKLYSENKYEQMQELFMFLNKVFPILGGLAFIFLYGASYPFIVLWTHDKFIYPGFLTAFCLASYAYFSWNSVIAYGILNSLNLNKMMYKLTTAEALLNLVLSCCFVRYLEIAGVVLGTLVANFIVEFILIPRIVYYKLNKRFKYDFIFVFKHTIFIILPVGILIYFINNTFLTRPYFHLLIICIVTIIYLLVSVYVVKLSYLKEITSKLKELEIF